MNLRKLKVKNSIKRNSHKKYFRIISGGGRVLTERLELYLPEFNALEEFYGSNLMLGMRSLCKYENHLAHVVRYYNIQELDLSYVLCKVEHEHIYFIITKDTLNNWHRKYNNETK